MFLKRLGGLCAALGMALGLGACADTYGYGGLNAGYADYGGYGGGYYDGYGGGYAGYAPSNFGWYGDYYYPGAGIYVYDRYRRPFRWNDGQRRYWSDRQRYRGRDWNGRGSWSGFDRNVVPGRGYDGDRRWQPGGNDRNPQWRGNRGDGNRQWRQRGDGVTPGDGYRGDRGRFRDNGVPRADRGPRLGGGDRPGRTFSAPSARGGEARGRSLGRSGRVAPSN